MLEELHSIRLSLRDHELNLNSKSPSIHASLAPQPELGHNPAARMVSERGTIRAKLS